MQQRAFETRHKIFFCGWLDPHIKYDNSAVMPQIQTLNSIAQVIDALGGVKAVADRYDLGVNAVRAWFKQGLPSRSYVAIQTDLQRLGYSAPFDLWDKMIPPVADRERA